MESIQQKRCPCCKLIKNTDAFGKARSNLDGKNVYCRECINLKIRKFRARMLVKNPDYYREKQAKYYKKHPDVVRAGAKKRYHEKKAAGTLAYHKQTPAEMRKYRLKFNFGITPEEYDRLLADQDGVCAICGQQPSGSVLAVDHNHSTGKVRGLLCKDCNTGIGFLQDNSEIARKASEYLKFDGPAMTLWRMTPDGRVE